MDHYQHNIFSFRVFAASLCLCTSHLVIFEEHSWPDELNVNVSLKLHKYSCIKTVKEKTMSNTDQGIQIGYIPNTRAECWLLHQPHGVSHFYFMMLSVIILYSIKWPDDQWMMNQKGCGRKWPRLNQGTIPACALRDRGKPQKTEARIAVSQLGFKLSTSQIKVHSITTIPTHSVAQCHV
jgi:hypothetical protein